MIIPLVQEANIRKIGIFFLIRDHMFGIIEKENIRTYFDDLEVGGHGDTYGN